MTTAYFCSHCGKPIEPNMAYCPHCSTELKSSVSPTMISVKKSPKSANITWLLCVLFGLFGIHRLYVNKLGTGFIMFITIGGFGLWTLLDLLFIVNNKFEDKEGRVILFSKNPSSVVKTLTIAGSILLWLVIFVGFILILAFYFTGGIVNVVNQQLDALSKNDVKAAYSYTSKDFQNAVSMEQFNAFLKQYPSLSHNKSAVFNEREVVNNTGRVKGTLTSTDGAQTPIEVRLIKENGTWKILSIQLSPTGITVNKNTSSSNQSDALKQYGSKLYSINYPADWTYEQPKKGVVFFNGKKGTPAYNATVNIQTILAKKTGGKYASLNEIQTELTRQISTNDPKAKIISQGQVELPTNPKGFQGVYIIFTHQRQGTNYKQMQFLLFRHDELAFYSWAYTAPEAIYDQYLPIAKAMYESWVIK